MLKQQIVDLTEYSSVIGNQTIIQNSTRSHSNNFKERINRLKAKVKPCLVIPESTIPISTPIQSLQFTETQQLHANINLREYRSVQKQGDQRTVSQNKVVNMKVTYRKQALVFKKKPNTNNENKENEKNSLEKQKGNRKPFNKLNLQIFQNITLQQKHSYLKFNDKKVQTNKQNISSNYCQIQDILINNYKTPLNSQREMKMKAKTGRFPKGITTIDVRECSARNSTDYHQIGLKRNTERLKGLKNQNGTRHMKTLSHNYRSK